METPVITALWHMNATARTADSLQKNVGIVHLQSSSDEAKGMVMIMASKLWRLMVVAMEFEQ